MPTRPVWRFMRPFGYDKIARPPEVGFKFNG